MAINSNQVKSLQGGSYADGGGLYLVVRDSGERVWAFRFTGLDGKRTQMEFARFGDRDGEAGDVLTLRGARDQAREYKVALKRDGIDPRVKKRVMIKGGKTFKEFAEEQYPAWCKGLSDEEEKQWQRSIRDVASLHQLRLPEITTEHVLAALQPIWTVKPITASRTRQRIERLLHAAKVLKLRDGENPALWRGNLKYLLPSPRKLNRKKSKGGHASAPYAKMPAVMTALRYEPGNAARCVEVGILTCARSKEIRLMALDELDVDAKQWTRPAGEDEDQGRGKAEAAPGAAVGAGACDHSVDAARRPLRLSVQPCGGTSTVLSQLANRDDQALWCESDDARHAHLVPQLGRRERCTQLPARGFGALSVTPRR